MIENTTCVSGTITSYSNENAIVTVKSIKDADGKPLELAINANTKFAGPAENDKSFAALRVGLSASVFLRENNRLECISPNYR